MYPNSKARIQKEFKELQNNKELKIIMINEDLFHWKGIIAGPPDTVYQDGKFQIDIVIPSNYPYHPPTMKFDTKIWHPNMSSQTGAICLDILKNEWSPALSIRTALLSIQALMCCPEPSDPQDAVVAKQFTEQRDAFNKQAKDWTSKYANPNAIEQQKMSQITDMGFPEDVARNSLEKFNWEVDAAINSLLS